MTSDGPRASANTGLVVVSNRLPVRMEWRRDEVVLERSAGGLAAALAGVSGMRCWVGWPGAPVAEAARKRVVQALRGQNLHPVFLSAEQERHYYGGMCNSALWPLLHYFPGRVEFTERAWPTYVEVNQLFAAAVDQVARPGDRVWVHDFHLLLLPALLRTRRPDLSLGFFLHVPFPSSELWRLLPQREALLRGLLGADHIAFHTADYLRHFRNACLRVLGIEAAADHIVLGGRHVSLGAHPIGTDVLRFQQALASPAAAGMGREYAARWRDRAVVLGIERLDYTKGVTAKFRAFERFLARDPQRAKQVVMLQVIVPSREEHEGYRALRREIEKEVGRINGRFGSPGVMPLEYAHRSLDDAELVALYRHANVMLVAPVRDGMNLVAQEFVLCQGHAPGAPDHARGMLVLSEFAGAAMVLPHAQLVNPWDIDAMADAIESALQLPPAERRARIGDMCERVLELDSRAWAARFLERLDRAAARNIAARPAPLDGAALAGLRARFHGARRRVLFLDYDGTLRELAIRPELALPTPEIHELLRRLAAVPGTEVHLVSGRRQSTIANWFADLPIHIGAEHGFHRRTPDGQWRRQTGIDVSWMPRVQAFLARVTEEVPGSFLEMKSSGIAWHYRLADPAYGPWRARELGPMLRELLADERAESLLGHAVVEVRAEGANKGSYVADVTAGLDRDAFVLCGGDDRTDLDMYHRLPEGALVVHVGSAASGAGYVVDSPAAFRALLAELLRPDAAAGAPAR